jgi:hypothetical protein
VLSSGVLSLSSPRTEFYNPKAFNHSRGVAGSGFRPLSNIPYCCLPQESGPCLSSSVADHPLRPATYRSLGKPLPYQQANRPQAHLLAPRKAFNPKINRGISSSFPELYHNQKVGYLRVTHPSATKLRRVSFDLHVLSPPLAFALSQDQTLQLKSLNFAYKQSLHDLLDSRTSSLITINFTFVKRSILFSQKN